MRKITILLIFMLFIVPLSLQAQVICDMNLDDEILELVQAQRDADNGDVVLAAHRLQQLSAVLSTIAANCSNNTSILEQEYIAPDASIKFQYPADWIVLSISDTYYFTAIPPVVTNFTESQTVPSFNAGETLIWITIRRLDENESFNRSFVDEAMENITGGLEPIEPIHPITINEREAFRAVHDVDPNLRVVYQFIDYSDSEVPTVILIRGIGIVDELPITQLYVAVIAESIEYLP
jgi:hypothetical protein